MKNKKNTFLFLAACLTLLVLIGLGIQANIEIGAKYHRCEQMRSERVGDFFGDSELEVRVYDNHCYVRWPVFGVPTWNDLGEIK